MAISGFIGANVADELQELLQRRLLEQREAEMRENAKLDRQLRQKQFDAQESDRQFTRGRLAKADEMAERAQRGAEERGAYEATARANMSELVNDPVQMAAFGTASGLIDPKDAAAMTKRPEPKRRAVTVRGLRGEPINRMVDEDEAVEEYRAPTREGGEKAEWFIRDGKLVRGTYQPGDLPYDPVAARQDREKPPSGPSEYSTERNRRTVESVDNLMGKVSRWTTGVGSLLSRLPETDARNFAAELNTLKANIAFNELTQMREASKTGGALGNVSNVELALLESTLGALDPGMSPGDLRRNLQKIKDSVVRFEKAKRDAAGGGGGGAMPSMRPMSSRDTAPPSSGATLRYNPATGKLEPIRE